MKDGNEFQYDFQARSDDGALLCLDSSKCVQADAEDADINVIMERFKITGRMPDNVVPPNEFIYDDIFDFQSAQNVVVAAQREFDRMPANIRARFLNSPQEFHNFVLDPNNLDECVRLGLAVKKVVDVPRGTEENAPKSEDVPPTK